MNDRTGEHDAVRASQTCARLISLHRPFTWDERSRLRSRRDRLVAVQAAFVALTPSYYLRGINGVLLDPLDPWPGRRY